MLAATVRVTRDLDVAEECVQDAYVAALGAWSRDGVPDRPGAWLTTAARRNALNVLRRARTLQTKLPLLIEPAATEMQDSIEASQIPDDRLRLIFTCCHPALAREAQVALTLRLVCGVGTGDIAGAFLVSEPTMAARLTRAKKKITAARIPYSVPAAAELPARVDAVLTVVHLLATTGHTAPSGDELVRLDLLDRALDLARMLVVLLPDDREVRGLLALLLVHQARREARTDDEGRLVLLEDQDRSRWDRDAIAEAHRLVDAALRAGPPGRYVLQAAIASLHAQAPGTAETDWAQIVRSTARCWSAGRRRSWRSTGRSRSRWSTGRRPRCRRSRRWRATSGSPDIATCTRRGPTCCAGSAAPRTRRPHTARPWR